MAIVLISMGLLAELLGDLLASDRIRRGGYFDPGEVTGLADEHRRGLANHRKVLWTRLAFELWRDRYETGDRE